MQKALLAAFIAIALLAVGAVDYINQAKAHGTAPGRLGIAAYMASISGRFAGEENKAGAVRAPVPTPVSSAGAKVSPIGLGTCSNGGLGKRCSVGD